jgi:hypothetical protein
VRGGGGGGGRAREITHRQFRQRRRGCLQPQPPPHTSLRCLVVTQAAQLTPAGTLGGSVCSGAARLTVDAARNDRGQPTWGTLSCLGRSIHTVRVTRIYPQAAAPHSLSSGPHKRLPLTVTNEFTLELFGGWLDTVAIQAQPPMYTCPACLSATPQATHSILASWLSPHVHTAPGFAHGVQGVYEHRTCGPVERWSLMESRRIGYRGGKPPTRVCAQ